MIDDLCNSINELDAQIKQLQAQRKDFMLNLQDSIALQVQDQLANKDYGCGTVTINAPKHQIKYVVSKRIKWDQSFLNNARDTIVNSGRNPDEYMKIKYDISETAYKSWPSDVQKFFESGRTVEQASPKIEIKEI